MVRPTFIRALTLLGVTSLAACVETGTDAPMRILNNIAPADSCVISPDATLFRDGGRIDTDAARGYLFTPVVINDITLASGDVESQRRIYITGARVHIEFYDQSFANLAVDEDLLTFQVPVGGSLAPGGGKSAFGFEVVPTELLTAVGTRLGSPTASNPNPKTVLDVHVQMVGTKAGDGVESNVFRYPVEVCVVCRIRNLGPCAGLPGGYMPNTGGACNLLQDGVLDCCTNGTQAVCPAAAPEA